MRSRALLLVLLLSCAPKLASFKINPSGQAQVFAELPVSWTFDCAFPREMKADARDGFNYWNRILGHTVFEEITGCGVLSLLEHSTPRVFVTTVTTMHPTHPHHIGTTTIGLVGGVPRSGVLRYYRPWLEHTSRAGRASVARHEVGHALGFEHSEVEWCLMYHEIEMKEYRDKPKMACRHEIEAARRRYPTEERR